MAASQSGPPFSKHLHLSWSSVIFGDDPWEVGIMVTPLYLLFAHTCSLPALLSIGTYPPF